MSTPTFGRPFRFSSEEAYEILKAYSRGESMKSISIRLNARHETIIATIRRGLLKLLGEE